MGFNKPIFGQGEEVFMIVEVTPELGYEVVYTGSYAECQNACAYRYGWIEPDLYAMYKDKEKLNFIILSSKLVNEAYYSFPKQRYTKNLHITGSN